MIESTQIISNEDGYKKYGKFEISDNLKELLFEDYFLYQTKEFKRKELVEALYQTNFIAKYDRVSQSQIFEQYIDNEQFKEKSLFVYSIINSQKFKEFVERNPEIQNPNDYTIEYSIIDSDGTSVQLYYVGLKDIAFVF